MIVNDKLDLRNIIRAYLKAENYTNLTVSENGQSALRRALADPPDMIIADDDLPELSGLELLKAVRQHPKLKDVPFILISQEMEQELVARAAEARVNAYVIKPFSHKTLADKVNKIFARRLNPTKIDLQYQEANRLVQGGHLAAALELYQEALSATQNAMASIHYRIGRIHERMERQTDAEENYHEAIGLADQYVDAYDALGVLNLVRRQAEDALKYLQQSSQISPLNAERQLHLGEALMETGEFQAAENAFRLALELDPSKTHVYNHVGISLRRQGKLDEAGRYLHRALELSSDDEHLYYNLGRVYLEQGEREPAMEYLQKALAINPDFEEAQQLRREIISS